MITVLAGGVGAARFLSGLIQIIDPHDINVVVNTADDFVLHGLTICPDLDTLRYTLSGDIGEQGWGRSNETWTTMTELRQLGSQAPDSSRATDWFALGDRDLAIHLYRTQRLREGADLSQVTAELTRAAGLDITLLPMTNDRVSTVLTIENGDVIDFQEYFVRRRHRVAVTSVEFNGALDAKASRAALEAIADAERLIIAPSNPIFSIGPLLALPEINALLRSQRDKSVAVSPLIGGRAVKGPADHLMQELGFEANVEGVATYLTEYATHIVADNIDAPLEAGIKNVNMTVSFTETLMNTSERARLLAQHVLNVPLDNH